MACWYTFGGVFYIHYLWCREAVYCLWKVSLEERKCGRRRGKRGGRQNICRINHSGKFGKCMEEAFQVKGNTENVLLMKRGDCGGGRRKGMGHG